MSKRKFFVVIALLGMVLLGGFSTLFIEPIETSAQQSQTNLFDEIDDLARQNKLSPRLKTSKQLAAKIIDALSVLDIPVTSKEDVSTQVGYAFLNGSSSIDENNIAGAINNLAGQSSAPSYAYTNSEQVKVVRKFLNRMMPNLVSANGNMDDLEALAVFTATLSQKFDNEAFMVSSPEFTASLGAASNQPFPGTTAANTGTVTAATITARMDEMENVLEAYANSGAMNSSSSIITSIGIQ